MKINCERVTRAQICFQSPCFFSYDKLLRDAPILELYVSIEKIYVQINYILQSGLF